MKNLIAFLFVVSLVGCAGRAPAPTPPAGPPGTVYDFDWSKVKTLADLKEIIGGMGFKLLVDPLAPPEKKKADEKLKKFVNIESGQLIPRN